MVPCPAEDRLVALLDEALTPGEFGAIEAHVGECTTCQAALERLNAFSWGEIRPSSVHSTASSRSAGPLPQIPGFKILEEIGRGGHGVVFRAIDRGLDRVVALKMIRHGALASDAESRGFLKEARAAARIRHPHIIPIYTVGEHEGQPYFTMELARGGNLNRRLPETGLSDVREGARLVEQLALAVHHAHECGVVHRDLKPANILLADDSLGDPRIADFGIARVAGAPPGRTPTGMPLGTPGYMAPELISGTSQGDGITADVFSLGAILYELLMGHPPFRGKTPFETLLLTRSGEPTPPTRVRPDLPRSLETICLKCLRNRPEDRYQAAFDLADDLRRFLNDETVHASNKREKRRHAASLSLVLVLVLASAWGGWWLLRRPNALPEGAVGVIRPARPEGVGSLPNSLGFAALADRLAEGGGDRESRLRSAGLLLNLVAKDTEAASNLKTRLEELAAATPETTVVARARRVGNLAAPLILAGDERFARPLLSWSSTPTARTSLIAILGGECGDLRGLLLNRAVKESDPGVCQALLLAIGRAGPYPAQSAETERNAAIQSLVDLYREAPDPGVHGAAEWTLRQWNRLDRLRLERNLLADARLKQKGEGDRNWYIGPHRNTLALLRPPVGRPFAIGTHEVSALQLEEFLRLHPNYRPRRVRGGNPACPVPLFMARAYCNWLSVCDGLGKELCYAPGPGDSYEPVPNDRERRGYRLPTEEEWRFACFGESATPFPYGHGEEFFAAYGFASAINPQNVGRLMPNDRGLFDMLGNACEWCERPGAAFPTACGGSYLFPPATVSALCTDPNVHPEAGRSIGFRVARTWR